MFRAKMKQAEIKSPLITAVLAARVRTRIETNRLFPGCARPLDFNERELMVIEQALRLATSMLEGQHP